ncbi:hypothetical protein ILUMI_25329 [Ignelater luminosus]|uniref:Integrase zinc-binding domain-containing protein n=1 Tax=Ignelater luminosus TaxID=2038154 RepID=A0A8K0CBW9_IGNLU|nr:hypothetical protein ILUMI_25329 [Ignelater luminosus]
MKTGNSSSVCSVSGNNDDNFNANVNARRCFKLPPLNIKMFSGDIKERLSFWSQFEDVTNPNSRARELLGSFHQSYEAIMFPLIEFCVPLDLLRAWQRSVRNISSQHDPDLPKESRESDSAVDMSLEELKEAMIKEGRYVLGITEPTETIKKKERELVVQQFFEENVKLLENRDLNLADLPSRESSLERLIKSDWLSGPAWLLGPHSTSPNSLDLIYDEEEIFKKRRKVAVTNVVTTTALFKTKDFDSYSSCNSTIQMVAWCRSEIIDAECNLLKLVQQEAFGEVNDKNIKSLCPFIDDQGLFRLKSKVAQIDDTFDFRYPILLPSRRPNVEKHQKLCHGGVQAVLCCIRKDYWTLQGRRAVKATIKRCVICKRHEANRMETSPVALPLNRVREAAVYEVTGIDLCGPVYLKNDKKRYTVCLPELFIVVTRPFQRIHPLEASTDDQITQNIEIVSEPPLVEEEEATSLSLFDESSLGNEQGGFHLFPDDDDVQRSRRGRIIKILNRFLD